MSPIQSVTSPLPSASPASPKAPTETQKAHDLEDAARQFEQIFVRSMLAESPLGKNGDAYGGMAIGALAGAVTQGKGLGLGELVKRAVETSESSLKKPR